MDELPPEHEAACLRALRAAWDDQNLSRFRGAMRPPALELSTAGSRLGQWDPVTRTIQLARALVVGGRWGQVLEVLKHEMAHQYVWEVLGVRAETPHGAAFQEVCARLGIDAAATGLPAADAAAAPDRIVSRVSKLLALAGSSNEHEARAAMAQAQRLMLKHNIEVAKGLGARRYGFRHLGRPTGRVPEAERILAGILGAHFFVECIWIPVWRPLAGKRGMVLEVCGTLENLELAEHVHGFLLGTADRLWREWRRETGARDCERRAYQAGVISGFRETLEKQAVRHREEALVWVGDPELKGYYRRRYPHVRSVSYASSARSEANAAGREAGRGIVLQRPVGGGGGGAVRGVLSGRT